MTAAHAALMRNVVAAFAQGDLKPLFDAIAPDIVWKSAARTKGQFVFGGNYTNRLEVVELTARISTAYVFWRITPKEVISEGDTVWGIFQAEGDYLPRGPSSNSRRQFALECAIRWRMRDGKISEHQTFFDTAALLRQQEQGVLRPPPI